MPGLDIIYRDDDIVAIDKPSGLLVHRSSIDRNETRFALQLLRDQIGQHVYPVHRLDKPTSGVLLFALNPGTARELSAQFEQQQVTKRYLAVVRGFAPVEGLIDYALKEKWDKLEDKRTRRDKPAQPAVTHYRRLATVELPVCVDRYPQTRYSLLEVFPKTGRRHQIRRHMKHIGHPLIGDAKHGKGVHNRFFQQQYECHRLLLSCTDIQCVHPLSGKVLHLRAGLDDAFTRIIAAFGWSRWKSAGDTA